MGSFIGKRLLAVIPIFLFATLLTFLLIRLSPVDPAEAYLSAAHIHPTDELLEQKRHEFGLDQPLPVQYAQFLMKMCRLDFGTSYVLMNRFGSKYQFDCRQHSNSPSAALRSLSLSASRSASFRRCTRTVSLII